MPFPQEHRRYEALLHIQGARHLDVATGGWPSSQVVLAPKLKVVKEFPRHASKEAIGRLAIFGNCLNRMQS